MNTKFIAVLSVGIVLTLGLGFLILKHDSKTDQNQASAEQQLQVVTTNSILEDMVENIGGEDTTVYSIVKRGTDPHEYEPKPNDVAATQKADVIFHNGLNLETGGNGWFKKLTKQANKKDDEQVFAASKTVVPLYLTGKETKNEPDPHAWLDLENGVKYVEEITRVLVKLDPKHADNYKSRSQDYIASLKALHQEGVEKFKNVPEEQRLLVTSEGAFKYFSKAYCIRPAFIWEINTEAQGTPEQLKQVLKQIKENDVRSLFVESSVSPKAMQQVANESDKEIYGKLYTDSLAKQGTKGDTYYDMVKWNLDTIYAGMTK
ncbi:MAG: metal ABC transporter substrate-binding protein [Lactobacillaceae bacterium]|jgi:iron/zinc/copper transport system substrate-binding protein|nr:metal ABC transporter substrate-binding protein [Lactobacillaceae bacterium]